MAKEASARRVARYSCYDQIAWRGKDGEKHEARLTTETLRAAMLAQGTQGHFTVYSARSATPYLIRWPVAIAYLANLKRGFYAHG